VLIEPFRKIIGSITRKHLGIIEICLQKLIFGKYTTAIFLCNETLVYLYSSFTNFFGQPSIEILNPKTINMKSLVLIAGCSVLLFSCVSQKKYKQSLSNYDQLNTKLTGVQGDLNNCNTDKANLQSQNTDLNNKIADLNKQVDFLKQNNTQALKQLEDLSVISASQAESIKKSMENIGAKDVYIQSLQEQMAKKDSLNMALVMNLKGAVGNLDDKDINIKVDKGVVYIDISDKLLFKSGKYEVTDQAKAVLGKVALVLKNQPDIEFMVEGHTDNVPYKSGVLLDNWDLSCKRATAVIRILQNQYGLDPAKMSAAGRGEYKPITDNNTPEGRAANRRTRIVILPQLDQFFKLLEPKKS
jgi:chemotaxis protein MotB